MDIRFDYPTLHWFETSRFELERADLYKAHLTKRLTPGVQTGFRPTLGV